MERRIKHSYTYSDTKIQLLKVSHEVSQKWNISAQEADFAIAGSCIVIHVVIQNHRKTRKNRNGSTSIAVSLWCHRESNQGHKDFQSFALPTELWHQTLF